MFALQNKEFGCGKLVHAYNTQIIFNCIIPVSFLAPSINIRVSKSVPSSFCQLALIN